MAKLSGEKVVVERRDPADNASFDDLRKIANEQSPVSTIDPKKYAKGK